MVRYFISGFFAALRVCITEHCKIIHVHYVVPTGIIGILVGKLIGKKEFESLKSLGYIQ